MQTEHLERAEARTLKANVTEILRESIVDGSLAPGTEFNQAQIAEQLGVSRGPIREALGQLEQEGLVESTPYKGVTVTRLTRRYVEELYSVRGALEALAIDRALPRLTQEDVEELNEIVADMRRAAAAEESAKLVELDLAFHETILRTADHDLAMRLWQLLEVGVRRCLHIRHEIYTFLDEVVGSHPTLVTALTERNRTLALQILDEHIAESASHILAVLPPDEAAADEQRDATTEEST